MRRCERIVLCLLSLGVARCQQPQAPFAPTRASIGQTDDASRERLWQAARDVLREQGFDLALVDRHSGRMTTKPVSSQHFFEVYRHDVLTRYDAWEATVAPIRRRVEVIITAPEAPDSPAHLGVEVRKERLSSPDRQFNDSGALFHFFGYLLPSTGGRPTIQPQDDRWIDLGRDGVLEAHLLDRIVNRAGGEATTPDPSTPP